MNFIIRRAFSGLEWSCAGCLQAIQYTQYGKIYRSTAVIEINGGTSGLEIDMVHGHEQKLERRLRNPQQFYCPRSLSTSSKLRQNYSVQG